MHSTKHTLFEALDEFGKVQVIEEPHCRKLVFDSEVEQGCLFLEAPMQVAYEYQDVILQKLEEWHNQHTSQDSSQQTLRVLMLGLGTGTLAQHLLYRFDLNLTVIELRQNVIDCAHEFFNLPDSPELEVLQADAIEFCQQHTHPFDVIIIDIFDAQGEASQLYDNVFLDSLWPLTKSPGLLVFNLWQTWQNESQTQQPKATESSQKVMDYWQSLAHHIKHNDQPQCLMNRYNIASSQNLVLTLQKSR